MKDADIQNADVVVVYLRSSAAATQPGVALRKPRLERLLDDRYLVGEVPASERDWASGLKTAVRLDEVQHLLLFESLEEYETRAAAAPAAWELSAGGTEPS